MSLDPKDLFDPIEGEPLRDILGHLQNANLRNSLKNSQQKLNESQEKTNNKLDEIASLLKKQEEQQRKNQKLPKCPYCGGLIDGTYDICRHCRSKLGYVGGNVCKIEEIEELQLKYDEAVRIAEEDLKKREAKRTATRIKRLEEKKMEDENKRKMRFLSGAEEKYISQNRICFTSDGKELIQFRCYCGIIIDTPCKNIDKVIKCDYCGPVVVYGKKEYTAFRLKKLLMKWGIFAIIIWLILSIFVSWFKSIT